ncbi:hypothetical protein B0H13DRAFT_1863087 [Mycena leptocephala]|nr:hypothetical protein B0H13DRAFT_1863087 [Mycena leptocephala]
MSILINGIMNICGDGDLRGFDPSARSVLLLQFRRQLGAASGSLLVSTVVVLFLFCSSSEFLRALLLMSSWAAYLRNSLISLGHRLTSTFDAWRFLADPSCLTARFIASHTSDAHASGSKPLYARSQFSVAYDVYLAVHVIVDKRVQVALGRNKPDWQLKNACPACTCLRLREKEQAYEGGTAWPGPVKERPDNHLAHGDYYLPRAEVDKSAKEGLEDLMMEFELGPENEEDEDDGCTDRWQNMKEDVTAHSAKYGFAVIAHMIRVLEELGIGYNIGCKFRTMIKVHLVLGPLATNKVTCLVGTFHGHGHNRQCQLKNLTTCVKGVGLEDAMRDLRVELRAVFAEWLEKEKTYLQTLSKEPLAETMDMEYYQKLVNLQDAESRRNTDTRSKCLASVQDLEIMTQWAPGDERWDAAVQLVEKRRHQCALDNLEGLVVARMFELAKCRLSGTAYGLCKHIAKALQACSKAVKTTIASYNAAAEAIDPPSRCSTGRVVECAFLADFDLLREAWEDIRKEPSALPSGRAAMDQHFKLLRADEEIQRFNLEIQRVMNYMVNEEAFLTCEEECLREEGKVGLVHQVHLVRMERGRFTALHMSCFVKLSKEGGFSGSILPGNMGPLPQDTGLPPGSDDEEGPDQGDNDDMGHLGSNFTNILRVSSDTCAEAKAS